MEHTGCSDPFLCLPCVPTQLALVPAGLWHMGFFLKCRNDPVTRHASEKQEQIPPEVHAKWLERTLGRKDKRLYVCMRDDGDLVGTCCVDFCADAPAHWGKSACARRFFACLSWTIAPEHRNKGYGTEMVKLLVKKMQTEEIEIPAIWAYIRTSNYASIKIAQRAGLSRVHENAEFITMGLIPFPPVPKNTYLNYVTYSASLFDQPE